MQKLTKLLATSILTISVISTVIESADADQQYDTFKKTQYREFQRDKALENCPVKKKRLDNITYTLCTEFGKPLYIILLPDNADAGVTFSYKNGQLLQVYSAEHFVGDGFRSNLLVVEWNDENQTVNTNLASPSYRQSEKRLLAESTKALKLFGINGSRGNTL